MKQKNKYIYIIAAVTAVIVIFFVTAASKVLNNTEKAVNGTEKSEQPERTSGIKTEDISEYIRAEAYAKLDKLGEEYQIALPVSEIYDNSCIESVCGRCADILQNSGITVDLEDIRNTSVEILRSVHMDNESREKVADMIEAEMSEYVAGLDFEAIDKEAFFEKMKACILSAINKEKEHIKFDADVLTSNSDIIAQIFKSHGMPLADAVSASNELSNELHIIYADYLADGLNLTDANNRLTEFAEDMAKETRTSVLAAIELYNRNSIDIAENINKFSEQYVNMQNSIKAVQNQISILEAEQSDVSGNTTQYVIKLTELKNQLSQEESSISELAAQISELGRLRESLTLLSVSQNNAKAEVENSVKALRTEFVNMYEELKRNCGNSGNDDDDTGMREKIESSVADIQSILDKLDAEKLTVNEFNQYAVELGRTIEELKAVSNTDIDKFNTELSRLSESFNTYSIASDAKMSADKAEFDKKVAEIEEQLSEKKSEVDNSISELGISLNSAINALEKKIQTSGTDAEDVLNELKRIQSELSGKVSVLDYQKAVSDISEELSKAEALTGTRFTDVTDKINTVTTQLESYNSSLEEKLEVLSGQVTGNKKEIENSIGQLENSLNSAISNLEGRVDANNTEAVSALNELKRIQNELQSGKVSITDYNSFVSDINSNIDVLERATDSKLDTLRVNVNDVSAALDSYKESVNGTLDNINADISSVNNQISSMDTRLDEVSTSISSLNQSASEHAAKIATLENSLESLKKAVSDGKKAVADAITAKGVQTATDASFSVMADNIMSIQTGVDTSDATAIADYILQGQTAYVKGLKITGTMPNYAVNQTQLVTLSSSDIGTSDFKIPSGYHSNIRINASNVYNAGVAAGKNSSDKNSVIEGMYKGLTFQSNNIRDNEGDCYFSIPIVKEIASITYKVTVTPYNYGGMVVITKVGVNSSANHDLYRADNDEEESGRLTEKVVTVKYENNDTVIEEISACPIDDTISPGQTVCVEITNVTFK